MGSSYITYQLEIVVLKPVSLTVGSLGQLELPPCTCLYTGSARRNFEARIDRHLRNDKKPRWHIDYLLLHPEVTVMDVYRFTDSECEVNQRVSGVVVMAGFGSSDCLSGCGSHLKRID